MSEQRSPVCPSCGHERIWSNGKTRIGKPQYRCSSCGRVFVLDPYFPAVVVEIAESLLQQQVPVPIITRAMAGKVSRRWLYKKRNEMRAASV